MNYCAESIAFINEAYGLLDEAKHHPEIFKPFKYRPLAYPYCLVLSRDNWKLTLCIRYVDDDITYKTIKALDNNQQVHELLGVYIGCLEKMEEDFKKNYSEKNDYCEAAIEFAKQVDYLIDIYNSQEYPNRPNGTTAYLSDGYHTVTIWNNGKLSLCRVEENGRFRNRKEIGDALIINNHVHLAPLLKKYLDSLRKHVEEL